MRRGARYCHHPSYREARDRSKLLHAELQRGAPPRRRASAWSATCADPTSAAAKLLATVVRLLDRTLIRVGNDEYARENKSYGLTTLQRRHVSRRPDAAGSASAEERRRAHHHRFRSAPGEHHPALPRPAGFQSPSTSSSDDVNDYLRDLTGREVTAKDFLGGGTTWLWLKVILGAAASGARPTATSSAPSTCPSASAIRARSAASTTRSDADDAYLMGHTVPQPPAMSKKMKRSQPGAALRRDEVLGVASPAGERGPLVAAPEVPRCTRPGRPLARGAPRKARILRGKTVGYRHHRSGLALPRGSARCDRRLSRGRACRIDGAGL